MKKILAILIALALCVGTVMVSAVFADDTDATETASRHGKGHGKHRDPENECSNDGECTRPEKGDKPNRPAKDDITDVEITEDITVDVSGEEVLPEEKPAKPEKGEKPNRPEISEDSADEDVSDEETSTEELVPEEKPAKPEKGEKPERPDKGGKKGHRRAKRGGHPVHGITLPEIVPTVEIN